LRSRQVIWRIDPDGARIARMPPHARRRLGGALLGGTLTSRLGHDRALLLRAGAAGELVLVAGALGLTSSLASGAARDGMAALLALAMGIQNAVARRLAGPRRRGGPPGRGDRGRRARRHAAGPVAGGPAGQL
jgi:hypothetical protein